jgi:hypothetical protein
VKDKRLKRERFAERALAAMAEWRESVTLTAWPRRSGIGVTDDAGNNDPVKSTSATFSITCRRARRLAEHRPRL